jgi:hypothetical protein
MLCCIFTRERLERSPVVRLDRIHSGIRKMLLEKGEGGERGVSFVVITGATC